MQISTVNRPSISLKGPVTVPQTEQWAPVRTLVSRTDVRETVAGVEPKKTWPQRRQQPAIRGRLQVLVVLGGQHLDGVRAASRGRPGPPAEPVLRLILAQLW